MFRDVKIVGIDLERCEPIEGLGRMQRVILMLSRTPSEYWCYAFNALWREQIYSAKRHAIADFSEIAITCLPEELDQFHMPHLKKVIEAANYAARARYEAARQIIAARQDRITGTVPAYYQHSIQPWRERPSRTLHWRCSGRTRS